MASKRKNDLNLWRPPESGALNGAQPSSPLASTQLSTSQLPEILKRQALAPTQGASNSRPAKRARSFADLLSRLYQQFDDLADEIATSNEPPLKRAEALKSLAKTLPLLKAAEDSAHVRLKDKAITDMSDSELERVIAQAQQRGQFPFSEGNSTGSTPTPAKNQKSDLPDVGLTPTSNTEEET